MDKLIKINRFYGTDKETLGTLDLWEGRKLMTCLKSLELPWKNNTPWVSCIPLGEYIAIPIIRPNGDWALWLQDVVDRTAILIHKGNFTSDIAGCILPGLNHTDIDRDGIMDVVQSTRAMEIIQKFVGKSKQVKVLITKSYHNHKF